MRKISPASVDQTVVAALRRYPPARQSRMWANSDGRPAQFKAQVTADLLVKQNHRCAYCGIWMRETQPHRDHIAPKGQALHPEFTFEVRNLVLACYFCNSERKGEQDTIVAKNSDYGRCEFAIVHPILDEPTDHIRFIGHRFDILVQAVAGSAKGVATIAMFDLASPELSKQRAKDAFRDSDVGHLHGRYKLLLQQVVFSPLPRRMVMKLR